MLFTSQVSQPATKLSRSLAALFILQLEPVIFLPLTTEELLQLREKRFKRRVRRGDKSEPPSTTLA